MTATPRRYVYAGFVSDAGMEPCLALRPVLPGDLGLGEPLYFALNPKRHRAFNVGHVYALPTEDKEGGGRSVTWDERTIEGPWPDAVERQAIAAASRAVERTIDATKAAERVAKDDLDMGAALRPLRRAYSRLRTGRERMAFEMLVLEALREYERRHGARLGGPTG